MVLFPPEVESSWIVCAGLREIPKVALYHDQPIRIAERQGVQKEVISGAEDGGGHADAKRKHETCYHRKAGTFAQHPQTEAEILPKRFQPTNAVHVIYLLSDQRQVAEFSLRGIARLFRRHASRDVFVRLDLEIHI
jgi:hypothetical protein